MLLYLSATDSDGNLTLTTNQTEVCLGDYYNLFCVSQEPFGNMCGVSTPSWYNNRTGRIDTTSNTKYNESTANATVAVLTFRITEEFNEAQTFYCAAATTCMSNEVLVRRYGEYKSGTHVYSIVLYLMQQAMHEAQLYTTHGLMLHAVKSYMSIAYIM